MDLLFSSLVILFLKLLSLIPVRIRTHLIYLLVNIALLVLPRFKKIAVKNLELAFPDATDVERSSILLRHKHVLADLISNALEMQKYDVHWIDENVDFSDLERYSELYSSEKGLLLITGHLGNFELTAHISSVLKMPLGFIVRPLPLKLLNDWWMKSREHNGNRAIYRKGAFAKLIKGLQDGQKLAILFDQNVTRKHAVFVPWFGKEAATTKAPAVSLLLSDANAAVAAMIKDSSGKYKVIFEQLEIDDIRNAETMDQEAQIYAITERAVHKFEQMIKRYPEGWFWMHRRWKTAKTDSMETFYR